MASIGKFVRKLRSDAQVAALIVTRENPASIFHARRTAVAAVVSLLIPRLFRLPEAYWSSISTLVIMQPTLGASLPISAPRFAGTAFGAVVARLIGSRFPCNALAFRCICVSDRPGLCRLQHAARRVPVRQHHFVARNAHSTPSLSMEHRNAPVYW